MTRFLNLVSPAVRAPTLVLSRTVPNVDSMGLVLRCIQCSAWPYRRRAALALLLAAAPQAGPGPGGLAVPAGDRIGQRVVHPRRLGLYCHLRHGDYLPRPGVLMRHQSPLALIPLAGVSGDMRRDLVPQRDGQHPAAPPPTRSHLRPPPIERTLVSDHLQHWRPFPPTLAAAFLSFDHMGRYAAPSLRCRVHNFVSYPTPLGNPALPSWLPTQSPRT